MSFNGRIRRKIKLPARLKDTTAWGTSSCSESSDDGGGEYQCEIESDSDNYVPIIEKKKVIKGKKGNTSVKSRQVGKVNEGAGTSSNNVHAPPLYRPDLPNPNTRKKRKISNNNVSLPSSTQINSSMCVVSNANRNAKTVGKGDKRKGTGNAKPVPIVYNWLNMDTPTDHIDRNFVYKPILPFPLDNEVYQPIDFFNLLFDQRVFEIIIRETNHFTTNCTAGIPVRDWVDVTEEELAAFFGIMIGTSYYKVFQLEDVWKSDWTRNNPNYSKIMTRTRFFQIKHNLHFNDNCKTPDIADPSYKLYKLEPIISLCTENFMKFYNLHQEVAVDESITRFKGRHTMKQYDASKPIKRGFKWWTLADSHSGYVYNMKLYTGSDKKKKGPIVPNVPCVPVPAVVTDATVVAGVIVVPDETVVESAPLSDDTTVAAVPTAAEDATVVGEASQNQTTDGTETEVVEALGTRAVLSVVSPHLDNKNHVVFIDRFFSSLPLLKALSEKGIYACGTIQKNRIGIPDCIKDEQLVKNLERGENHYVVERDTGIQLFVWQDRKSIYFINNFYPCQGDQVVRRKNPNGSASLFSCPPAVFGYNKYMNGVDRADQLRQIYSIDRKSKRWPMRLFWHCLDTSICNAYILYKDYLLAKGVVKKKLPDQITFRSFIVKNLIGGFTSRRRAGRRCLDPPPQPRLGPNAHKLVDRRKHGVLIKKRCIVCLKLKQRRESFYGCMQCNVSLCQPLRGDCFEKYHTQLFIH